LASIATGWEPKRKAESGAECTNRDRGACDASLAIHATKAEIDVLRDPVRLDISGGGYGGEPREPSDGGLDFRCAAAILGNTGTGSQRRFANNTP
jgi:hypothetical protein